tara:strand:- start:751 stop:939 length:189 start_codon:yes stop_codon:yes gene_type:complete
MLLPFLLPLLYSIKHEPKKENKKKELFYLVEGPVQSMQTTQLLHPLTSKLDYSFWIFELEDS